MWGWVWGWMSATGLQQREAVSCRKQQKLLRCAMQTTKPCIPPGAWGPPASPPARNQGWKEGFAWAIALMPGRYPSWCPLPDNTQIHPDSEVKLGFGSVPAPTFLGSFQCNRVRHPPAL